MDTRLKRIINTGCLPAVLLLAAAMSGWAGDPSAALRVSRSLTPPPPSEGDKPTILSSTSESTPSPASVVIWYLPAGGTMVGGVAFDTYILIANPEEEDAVVEIRYVGTDEEFESVNRTVAAGTRYTENMRNYSPVGPGRENVAAIIRSINDVPVIVERAMYFPGGEGSANWHGGHNTIGLDKSGTEWFLAEGATHIFDQYVHILNPGTETAEVEVTFFNERGDSWPVTNDNLGGGRVWTVKANDHADGQGQLSTWVESDRPVAVDRTMYWPKGADNWQDGHSTIGVTEFAKEWYLPEGATHIFNQYVLVANPSETEAAEVGFTFTDQDGDIWFHQDDIPARRRHTVKVNDIAGWENKDQVSTRISSNIPVVAERAMYWPAGPVSGWTGGHGTVGVSSPATVWQLPEGATHIFDQYVLVANPSGTEAANVDFAFRDDEGNSWEHDTVVEPGRRYTVKVNNVVGEITEVRTTVKSTIPVVAERAMYLPDEQGWKTGHVTVGMGEPIQLPVPSPVPSPDPSPLAIPRR